MKIKRCKCGCGKVVEGHPNKRFFNKKHKDKYWNEVNPRGHFAHLNYTYGTYPYSVESVGEKIDPIEDDIPFNDPDALGRD